jgi:hypothetical protein
MYPIIIAQVNQRLSMILYVLFQNAPAIATKRKHFKLCHHKKKSAVSFID